MYDNIYHTIYTQGTFKVHESYMKGTHKVHIRYAQGLLYVTVWSK